MMKIIRLGVLVLCVALPPAACETSPQGGTNDASASKIDWVHQVDSLLMPFWLGEAALGNPVGNFPTYLCDDGSVSDCPELDPANIASWVLVQSDTLRRDFLRIKSRQTYAYSVAYHMTGHEPYMKYAKAGVDYLMANGEYDTGSPVTFWQEGEAGPDRLQRNTQDLAYSLVGLAMYYSLTREDRVLDALLRVKEHIFAEYYDKSTTAENTRMLMWVREPFEADSPSGKSLVAQLDQLNAYLLLLTPLLPDPPRASFEQDAATLCRILRENFYDAELNLFWGQLDPGRKRIGVSHLTDFGHTIKSFWMCYLAGKQAGDPELVRFAESNARRLLDTAYLVNEGAWASAYADESLELDRFKIAWIYAELDQMAATLSLEDPTLYSRYLEHTYDFWENTFIDHEHKGVFMAVDEVGQPLDSIPKVNHWANGYHALEHALIGHLSTAQYHGDEIELYYAFAEGVDPASETLRPYLFGAEVERVDRSAFASPGLASMQRIRVIFTEVTPTR
jgi:mannose/cellobiose epimerase-like protein (N-acyl-D-glucosamine 2-epimerase family)